jgi:hypothetical protein
MKEERDNVVAENEELQEQLDQANSTASAGNMRINELRYWSLGRWLAYPIKSSLNQRYRKGVTLP